jgi:biopolymer transport protein ExbD
MKLNVSRKVHYESGPNMTPLVDIVMVILIFLMLAGSFGGAEHYLTSNIPLSQKGLSNAPPPPGWVPDEPLEIRVDPVGDAGFRATAGRIRASEAGRLTSELTQMREQLNRAGTPTNKIQVVISPGKNVQYDHLIRVYESALNAKFEKVAFATAHD